ncbi:MAG: TetR/AcrR family transcriptional regulator [Elusimicrobia bacterium]|nr:TetR/AcrR family transcriptional regulator [Elusimicrobiota bacterium]
MPITDKGSRTRGRLITASGAVFARKGFARSGVSDICARAGLAVGGFYRYFATKDEVIDTLARELKEDFVAAITSLPKASDPRGEARAIAGAFFTVAGRRLDSFKAIREAEASREALAREFYGALAGAIVARLARFSGGTLAEAHAWALLGTLYFYAVKFLIWEKGGVPPEALEAAVQLCAAGVSRRPLPWREPALLGIAQPKSNRNDTGMAMISAAEEVFGRSGYSGARVAEIAKRAGFASGTFYLFFASKREAIEKVVMGLRDALVKKAAAYSAGAGSRLEVEVLAFRALFDFIKEHPYGYRIMREAEFADAALADMYYGYILRNYSAQIKKSARPGEFTLKDPELLALALMGMGHMIGMKRVLWGDFRKITETELLKAVFGGLEGV